MKTHHGLWTVSIAALLAALPVWSEEPALPDLTSFVLMRNDTPGGAPVSVSEAADILVGYDVIFIGEAHTHPGNHLAEMQLFRAIQERYPAVSLSMEQFERDTQRTVDEYLAGKIGENPFTADARAWNNYSTSYRPLIEYAKEHKLPVIAANAPEKVVRCVGLEGEAFFAHMKPEERGWAAAELHLQDGPYKDKFLGFVGSDEGHGGDGSKDTGKPRKAPSEQALRSFAAQVTRDDTMAESIALHLQKNAGRKVVHVNGSFHSEGFLGTVERLQARMPNLKIAVVNPEGVEKPENLKVSEKLAKGGTFTLFIRELPDFYASEAEMKDAIKRQVAARKKVTCEL